MNSRRLSQNKKKKKKKSLTERCLPSSHRMCGPYTMGFILRFTSLVRRMIFPIKMNNFFQNITKLILTFKLRVIINFLTINRKNTYERPK